MANRYWVGGAGTWSTTLTTNWSATSGGSGGASVPSTVDSVFFDQAGTYTVTMTGALLCLDITVSAGVVTFANGTTPSISISGSMNLLAGTVWSSTGSITFTATTTGKTITTNGTVLTGAGITGVVSFNGAAGGWTLGSALTTGSSTDLSILRGTFDTGGYAITCGQFVSTGTLTRAIYLNNSTVSIGGGYSYPINITSTGVTFSADTSTFNCSSSTGTCTLGAQVFNNFNVTGTATNFGTSAIEFVGGGSFNTLTITGPATPSTRNVSFTSGTTQYAGFDILNFNSTGTAGNRRIMVTGSSRGLNTILNMNGTTSLSDVDFRNIEIIGTVSPVSGTRIGNRGNCSGITFSTPKSVYWNLAGPQSWSSANAWATTPTGTPSIDNFPLPQDTATFTDAGSVTGTITIDNFIGHLPGVNMSGRTTAMTLDLASTYPNYFYGDWTNGSGTTLTTTTGNYLTLDGGGTQTITSSGKSFPWTMSVDTYGGTVRLGDAFVSTFSFFGGIYNALGIVNGTFDTQGYALTLASTFRSSDNGINTRAIYLRSSTVTINTGTIGIAMNRGGLAFNPGTSTINLNYAGYSGSANTPLGGLTYYNMIIGADSSMLAVTITGTNTFNNLTFRLPTISTCVPFFINDNQIINGTFACTGGIATQRVFLGSNTNGTQRTLTCAAANVSDCDFRDINIDGAVGTLSGTRLGDCGGNSNITFPAAKTVYWNLAGTQFWSATGWATTSGGTPNINNFPLAQDTAVFNDAGAGSYVSISESFHIGTFDSSARTSGAGYVVLDITLYAWPLFVYGDWKWGTGVTPQSSSGSIQFNKPGTQTITSNGVTFPCNITCAHTSGYVQLADALILASSKLLNLALGTFDAVSYNVSTGLFNMSGGSLTVFSVLRMGSGTWSITGTGSVWNNTSSQQNATVYPGTSTIILTDTSTTARTFACGGHFYNKLTIGGTTGASATSITATNNVTVIGELASTKTVAHSILFSSSITFTIGKWGITGTAGNVVTVNTTSGSGTFNLILTKATFGIDYLSVSNANMSGTPGEFYVGANSTLSGGVMPILATSAPTPRTLYWVGGTGNWSATTSWSLSSGGPSGEAIPTSLDLVIFDSASNATTYTATVDATSVVGSGFRCGGITLAGPASGFLTFTSASSYNLLISGNFYIAATGVTYLQSGGITLSGNSSYTITQNGTSTQSNAYTFNGIGATWTLGSAFSLNANLTLTNGNFDTAGYTVAASGTFSSTSANVRGLTLNTSTITLPSTSATFTLDPRNLNFNAGTSLITAQQSSLTFTVQNGGLTFYNVTIQSPTGSTLSQNATISGTNTFNNLTFTGVGSGSGDLSMFTVSFNANQIINGTFTVGAGFNPGCRILFASNTQGTQRTLTCAAISSLTDVDFRDINFAGAISLPVTGTRLGNCRGNSNITFNAAKTVYFAATGSSNYGTAANWSATSGSGADPTQFPLAQDIAVFPAATYPASASTITYNVPHAIGTIDMSLRTTNLMTLATGTVIVNVYGDWINGSGTTLTGSGTYIFQGRNTQLITNAGKVRAQLFQVNSIGGTVVLQDALSISQNSSSAFTLLNGTFNAVTYNVSLTGVSSGLTVNNSNIRTLGIGSGTWTIAGLNGFNATSETNLTVTGTGTISLTGLNARTVTLAGTTNFSNITFNFGGSSTLTFSLPVTNVASIGRISKTSLSTASIICSGALSVGAWTASGTASTSALLTLAGSSTSLPFVINYTGAGVVSGLDYMLLNYTKVTPLQTTWYAGTNSYNRGGTLGWILTDAPVSTFDPTKLLIFFP